MRKWLWIALFGCSDYSINSKTDDVSGEVESETAEPGPGNESQPENEPDENEENPVEEADSGVDLPTEPSEPDSPPPENEEEDEGFESDAPVTPVSPEGKVVTILMSLSGQWIPEETASLLIQNSVSYVSNVPTPRVLVVRDDNHNNEDSDDPLNFTQWLLDAGFDATFMEEPSNGLSASDLSGYHVVVLSNPGYPPDDVSSIEAMYAFSQQGYGIIFQGDDMTRINTPLMEELTRLVQVDNGTSYYGTSIDNNGGGTYAVRMVASSVLNVGISELNYTYGNDIDTTSLATGSVSVAAWTTVQGSNHPEKPAITIYEPQQTVFE